jgi:hypothetical protein
MSTTAKINTDQPHCECCGSQDHEDLHTGDQGYTACCNELVCYGDRRDRWGDHDAGNVVTACCSATMVSEFERRNQPIPDTFWRDR